MSSMKLVRPLTTADGTPVFLRHPKTRVPLDASGTLVDFSDHDVAIFFKRRAADGDVAISDPEAPSAAAKSTPAGKPAKGAE